MLGRRNSGCELEDPGGREAAILQCQFLTEGRRHLQRKGQQLSVSNEDCIQHFSFDRRLDWHTRRIRQERFLTNASNSY